MTSTHAPSPAAAFHLASDILAAARDHGSDRAAFLLDVLTDEAVRPVAAAMADYWALLAGPTTIGPEQVRTGALALLAGVEAAMDADHDTVAQLQPQTLDEALVQTRTAVRVLADLLGLASDPRQGRAYLATVRADILAAAVERSRDDVEDHEGQG